MGWNFDNCNDKTVVLLSVTCNYLGVDTTQKLLPITHVTIWWDDKKYPVSYQVCFLLVCHTHLCLLVPVLGLSMCCSLCLKALPSGHKSAPLSLFFFWDKVLLWTFGTCDSPAQPPESWDYKDTSPGPPSKNWGLLNFSANLTGKISSKLLLLASIG
jgi:hypothetical protein